MAVRDYGDQALLLECESTDHVLAVTAAAREADLPGVLDIVPGARTVLVKVEHPRFQASARQRLSTLHAEPVSAAPSFSADAAINVVIDVVYDGDDLAEVAERTGLGIDGVINAHTGTPWRVGFSGFAPGFAYLIDGDPRLHIPRRAEPRTQVPAGAVGLAGEFSGVYPRRSPGGWQLIGRTDAVMWDVARPEPALLTPGMWVQFRAI